MIEVLIEPNYDSFQNMARDREMVALSKKLNAPILRIYGWNRPTISLGRLQKESIILDPEIVSCENMAVIKRPTGGRAVLHSNEVTYSFAFHGGLCETYGNTVHATYMMVSKALVAGINTLGAQATLSQGCYTREAAQAEQKLPCYLSTIPYEVEIEGKKLIGSAQRRQSYGVIQHGSIPLDSSYRDVVEYEQGSTALKKERRHALELKSISLKEALGTLPSFDEVAEAIIKGFATLDTTHRYASSEIQLIPGHK